MLPKRYCDVAISGTGVKLRDIDPPFIGRTGDVAGNLDVMTSGQVPPDFRRQGHSQENVSLDALLHSSKYRVLRRVTEVADLASPTVDMAVLDVIEGRFPLGLIEFLGGKVRHRCDVIETG